MASLSPKFATEVRDLLRPPNETPYEVLKAELTKWTSASEQRRIKELLSADEELGDRTSSQILRRIQQLLGSMVETVDATLLRELFLQRLPSNVRMVLTPSAADLSLNQIAQLADRIVEASPTPTISATVAHTANTHSQLTVQVMELTKHLDQLTSQMSSTVNNLSKRQGHSQPWRT